MIAHHSLIYIHTYGPSHTTALIWKIQDVDKEQAVTRIQGHTSLDGVTLVPVPIKQDQQLLVASPVSTCW